VYQANPSSLKLGEAAIWVLIATMSTPSSVFTDERRGTMAKNGVQSYSTGSGWAVGVLVLSVITGVSLRVAYSQGTTPAAQVSPLSDSWKGDKLDPKWHVTLHGDAQDFASASSIKVENGLLRLRVQSGEYWNDNDNGMYIWQPANGDFQVVLELRSITKDSSEAAKVGIMVRESLDRFAPNVFQQAMPKGNNMQVRTAVGESTGPGSGCSGDNCVQWGDNSGDISTMRTILKRLTRTGKVFKADYSDDGGKTWKAQHKGDLIAQDTQEVAMPDDVLVGIGVTGTDNSAPTEAVVGPITFTQLATRPTDKGLIAATATNDGGTPVADTGLEVLKGSDVVGTSVHPDFSFASNTASFFLAPGSYTVRSAENDTHAAGAPVPFEIKTGALEELKVKVGKAK
jgi:hypothetical protein